MAKKQTYEIVKRKDFPPEVRVRIVQLYAKFNTPTEIVRAIKEEFDLDIQAFQTYSYDPKRPAGADLDPGLVEIFEETREKYKKEIEDIPIANQAYRLHKLQKALERAVDDGNIKQVMEALAQAAKETGGAFTRLNILQHENPDGSALAAPVINVSFGGPPQISTSAPTIDITPTFTDDPLLLPGDHGE